MSLAANTINMVIKSQFVVNICSQVFIIMDPSDNLILDDQRRCAWDNFPKIY